MFKNKQKDKKELVEFIDNLTTRKINVIQARINNLINGIDFNGEIAGEIMAFLLDKSGYMFYQETGALTEKELKSLGEHKEFIVKGVKFLIAKPGKVEGKIKKTKVTKRK